MILYIYKLNNFDKDSLNNLPKNIKIQNQNNGMIRAIVSLENFSNEIIICLNSNFLFIMANKKSEKRKLFKFLYSHFKGNLSYFRPSSEEEFQFLNSTNNPSLKFIHDNKIQYSNSLTKKYFEKKLNEDYYLFEANIKIDSIPDCYFLYYGDAIKIKDIFKNYLDEIITFFEDKWVVG